MWPVMDYSPSTPFTIQLPGSVILWIHSNTCWWMAAAVKGKKPKKLLLVTKIKWMTVDSKWGGGPLLLLLVDSGGDCAGAKHMSTWIIWSFLFGSSLLNLHNLFSKSNLDCWPKLICSHYGRPGNTQSKAIYLANHPHIDRAPNGMGTDKSRVGYQHGAEVD